MTLNSHAFNSTETGSSSDRTLRMLTNYRIKRAANAIHSEIHRALKPLGLRMLSFFALTVIVDNPGIRLAQVAQILAMERPNLVAIVDQLQKSGWITRDADPRDRRAFALNPTTSGFAVCRAALDIVQEHERTMTAALDSEEEEVLRRALFKIEIAGRTVGLKG
ncbi:MAG: MarR family winged helix-turn-helix transcriptional regulator [Paracoccaceae bacterium]